MAHLRAMNPFSNIRFWLTFVGYGRSGHSFVGSALDAHPNMCITHEADAIRRSSEFKCRDELFESMYRHDLEIVARGRLTDNRWGDPYNQQIEGQYKPDPSRLKLIGNKNASIETQLDKAAFDRRMSAFQTFLGRDIQIKLVAVLRNPFDAGLLRKEAYTVLQKISEDYESSLHVVRHEDFIADPRGEMERLLVFLEQDVLQSHLDAVAEKTLKTVHKARFKIGYSEEEKKRIQENIDANSLFKGYSYHS